MMPAAFHYEKPQSLGDAQALLKQHGADARLLAGGQSLLPLLKTRAVTPKVVIDLGGLKELRGISREDGSIRIGALTTQAEMIDYEEMRHWFSLFDEDLSMLSDPIVRYRGTFAGSLAFADPAADWPAIALALNAQVHVAGANGQRTIPIDEFFVDSFKTSLQPNELITNVTLPVPQGRPAMVYRKLRHPASGFALVGVAAVLGQDGDKVCRDCRVAVTGAGRRPVRAKAVETALQGQRLTLELIAAAAEHATEGIDWASDSFAGPDYRKRLAETYVKRALLEATGLQ